MKIFNLFFTVILMLAFVSCDKSASNSEIEKQLEGTWVAVEQEYDEGIESIYRETLTFDASDNTFVKKAEYEAESINFGYIKINGRFTVDGDYIDLDWQNHNVTINLSKIMVKEWGGKKQIMRDLEEEKGLWGIKKLDDDRLILVDGDKVETEFRRYN